MTRYGGWMLHVLGPQRPTPNAPACLDELGGTGSLLVITAGWRHDETDDEALRRHLGPDVVLLPVYTWFEVIAKELPDLRAAYRKRQDQLLRLRRLHRLRLHPALDVVRSLWEEGLGDDPIMAEELASAMAHVRSLDEQLLVRCDAIHAAWAERLADLQRHKVVAGLMDKAAEAVAGARTVAITGGHVAVLLNRLRFFGVDAALQRRHQAGGNIVAWSAGAMALTDRIVLYYDDPPDGPTHPELLDRGLGLVHDVVLLPHARQRLRLDDRSRVALLAQRFAPTACIGLENGSWLARDGDEWVNRGHEHAAVRLQTDGGVPCLRCP